MISVYLASRYSRRAEMQEHASILHEYGFNTVSRWVYGEHEPEGYDDATGFDGLSDGFKQDCAEDDLEDIVAADMMISFTDGEPGARGGRHAEFGFALALVGSRYMVLIGPREHVFHWSRRVHQYDSLEQFIAGWK